MRNSKLSFSVAIAVSPILGVGMACAADLAAQQYFKKHECFESDARNYSYCGIFATAHRAELCQNKGCI